MALHFFDFFRPKETGRTESIEVTVREMFDAAQELRIRELCWGICVDMIANAIGRCEFRTFRGGEEVQEDEYFLWNYEPNMNENSTIFLHKLVAKLYERNEVLVVDTKRKDGKEALVVADDWDPPLLYPSKQNEYKHVRVGEVSYNKTFRENDVIHMKLNNSNIREVINGVYQSYIRLYDAAVRTYRWSQGQHWKVHVSQMAQGQQGWTETFQEMLTKQVKPFLDSDGAVLPEFDGYAYENVGPNGTKQDTRDIRNLVEDIFDFTARGLLIPVVLANGKVEATEDANTRFLTNCIDPLADQLQEEITRKRYGLDGWKKGNYIRVDTSSIIHFDLFANATNVEKLVGSGAYTINDVRRAANQATINEPWADKHYMTLNISTVGQATRQLGKEEET